jgi:hypothetical protein
MAAIEVGGGIALCALLFTETPRFTHLLLALAERRGLDRLAQHPCGPIVPRKIVEQ